MSKTTGQPRFAFYEEVEVRVSGKTRDQGIAGRRGAITGIANPEQPGQPVTYAIHVFGKEETWSVEEADLISTGRFVPKEILQSDESVHVSERGELLGE
jgi:hypothetical protein